MPIETDLKSIKKHHSKTDKVLKKLSAWQMHHEKEDATRFGEMTKLLEDLPTEKMITDAVGKKVDITINGNLRDIKMHLTQQDKNLEEISKKIKPFDQTRTWFYETGKAILYIGALAIATGAIIELLILIHVLN
jgi:hypothetical protein